MLEQLVGQVVRQIRTGEGDSLRDAEARSGINRCLLHRLENGRTVRNLREIVERFASAYGRRADLLLQGLDSRGAFAALVSSAAPHRRSLWLQMSMAERTALTAQFFLAHGGTIVTDDKLAKEATLTLQQMNQVRCEWRKGNYDQGVSKRVAAAITSLTGISERWFKYGMMDDEEPLEGLAPSLDFVTAVAQAGPEPLLAKERMLMIQRVREMLESAPQPNTRQSAV